jgi:hypothetical protein
LLRGEIDGFVKGATEDVAIVKGKAGKRLLLQLEMFDQSFEVLCVYSI